MTDYEKLRARHSARYGELFGEYLEAAGLAHPELTLTRVAEIERTSAGKHRRFVPVT